MYTVRLDSRQIHATHGGGDRGLACHVFSNDLRRSFDRECTHATWGLHFGPAEISVAATSLCTLTSRESQSGARCGRQRPPPVGVGVPRTLPEWRFV